MGNIQINRQNFGASKKITHIWDPFEFVSWTKTVTPTKMAIIHSTGSDGHQLTKGNIWVKETQIIGCQNGCVCPSTMGIHWNQYKFGNPIGIYGTNHLNKWWTCHLHTGIFSCENPDQWQNSWILIQTKYSHSSSNGRGLFCLHYYIQRTYIYI